MAKVFLSYSWENEPHRDWVRRLAHSLVDAGVEVRLDQWDVSPGESVTAFMEQEVATADYVIAVCTPTFASKAEKRTGGVGYEQQIVSGALLSGTSRSKFIPIIRSGEIVGENRALPLHFSGTFFLDFRNDDSYAASVEQLLRAIFKSPKHERPPLGKQPEYVRPAAPSAEIAPSIRVGLDAKHRLAESDAELLAYEISRLVRRSGSLDFSVHSPGYSDERVELSHERDLSPQRKLELLRRVHGQEIYEQDRDEIVKESLRLLVEYLYPQLALASQPSVAAKVLSKLVEIWSSSYEIAQGGSKFDLVYEGYKWSFGIHLSKEETEDLERSEGTERKFMTLEWGLRVGHLSPTVVAEKVVPGMIREFMWNKYARKAPPDPSEFFNLQEWRVGLG